VADASDLVSAQATAFVGVALVGAAVGLSYDVHRALWMRRGRPRRWGHLADAAWAASAGGVVGIGLLAAADGEVRLYSALALGTGLWAYFGLASPVVLPVARAAVGAAARAAAASRRALAHAARALRGLVRRAGGRP